MGVLGEQLRLLSGRESTAQHFERLSELRLGERALALHIVVLEEVLNSFAFVLGAMGALADLFKDNILYVSDLTWFVCLVVQGLSVLLWKAPCLRNCFGEVRIFLIRQSTVLILVELEEVGSRNLATLDVFGKALLELFVDACRQLLARGHSGVLSSSELGRKLIPRDRLSTVSSMTPSFNDNFHALSTD